MRVLMVSSNGTGMGHLTRLLAMARRRSAGTQARVLSMSAAVPVAAADGLDYEYVPSADDVGMGARRWNSLLLRRYTAALHRWPVDAVVFDGTFPYEAIGRTAQVCPGAVLVWSRRGMWRAGQGRRQLAERSGWFDLVLEPGDLAREYDSGLTTHRGDAVVVPPVLYQDQDDAWPRAAARRELGLAAGGPAFLVTLGAGNVNDTSADALVAVQALAGVPDAQVCLASAAIARSGPVALPENVRVLRRYPLAPLLQAFDAAVAAAGYNSFHELVAFGIPTVFVPNPNSRLDDQLARASWAADARVALCVCSGDEAGLRAAVGQLTDPTARAPLAKRCRQVWPGNGAGEAIRLVEGRAQRRGAR